MKHLKSSIRRSNGLTLIEVLMALVIMGFAAACSYDILRSGLMRFKKFQIRTTEQRDTAIAFALLSKDLRSAFLSSDQDATRFVGYHDDLGDHLDFSKARALSEPTMSIENVGYFLTEDKQTGERSLQRSADSHTIDLCPHVSKFVVRYFNGNSWEDQWGWDTIRKKPFEGIRGLPALVSISLIIFDSNNQPLEEKAVIPIMTSFLNRSLHV